jgi:hypothetical protein
MILYNLIFNFFCHISNLLVEKPFVDELILSDEQDYMQDYNMDGDDNDFNLFSPILLTPELETKKKKHLSGSDNRVMKKPRLQLSPENSPSQRERDFPEFENNRLLEVEDEMERLKVEQYVIVLIQILIFYILNLFVASSRDQFWKIESEN